MKKILCLVLCLLATLSLCGCSQNTSLSKKTSEKEKICDDLDSFYFTDVEGGVALIDFYNPDYTEYDKIIIPSEYEGKPVVGIGVIGKDHYVMLPIFGNCEVVIPDTVKYIAGKAFTGAEGLAKLSGGANVSKIEEFAFMNCTNLKEITFIDNVEDIADSAFIGCDSWNGKK